MTRQTKYVAGFFASLALAGAFMLPVLAAGGLTPDDVGVTAIERSGLKLSGGDVRQTAARIINVALGFLGIISVGIVLFGGFKYMISGGSTEKTDDARKFIVAGIIGLAIILSAWAITNFVITRLISATAET